MIVDRWRLGRMWPSESSHVRFGSKAVIYPQSLELALIRSDRTATRRLSIYDFCLESSKNLTRIDLRPTVT